MGEQVRKFSKEAVSRWKNRMPRFFRLVCWVCSLISGTVLAVNAALLAAGITPHEWWTNVLPYLIGIPAGMAFVAKFTQTYPKEESKNTILDNDNF